MACGKYHCVVRTTAGGVYTWGSARWGLMGTASTAGLENAGDGTEWYQPRPTRVVALEAGIVCVAAGGNYSLALDDTGQVCATLSAYPQLGMPSLPPSCRQLASLAFSPD